MNFEEFKLSEELKDAVKKMNYENATQVQQETIPPMLAGHNVIVKSHTGSGKTAAFGIPLSENIFLGKSKSALILCPTRELAVQVKEEIKKLNSRTRLKVSVFYGGHGMSSEMGDIRKGIDILCATPGRLLDHFRNKNLDPRQFDTVVLDEADRMLDMGFIQDLKEILGMVKPQKTHLFSATLDGSVAHLIEEYIPTYEEILLQEEIIGKTILERHIKVQKEDKMYALLEILQEAKGQRVLVFVATKRTADFLARKIYQEGYKTESIHGDKSQKAREIALQKFKSGKATVLVATDVAARGLQIGNIEYIVNYDLAGDEDTHKHRIGRTGRMGDTGHAITFVGEDGRYVMPMGFGGGRSRSGGRGGFRRQGQGSRGSGQGSRDRPSTGGFRSRSGPRQGGSSSGSRSFGPKRSSGSRSFSGKPGRSSGGRPSGNRAGSRSRAPRNNARFG